MSWQQMILNSFGFDAKQREDTAEEKRKVATLKKKLMAENPKITPDRALGEAIAILKKNGGISKHYGNDNKE